MIDQQHIPRWAILTIAILVIPAFFLNLGYIPFIEDEAIRAQVAYEMLHSGNYIVPTINGDPYYHKPPLYNWFIVLSYSIFGEANEWTSRFPTLVFLFGFTYYIYKTLLRQRNHRMLAIATALSFLTCGRILFYDSFLGLIDICFSWVTFALLISFYDLKSNSSKLFLIYVLATIAYFLKGFPSFIFLVCGMMTYVIYFREISRLLTKWHLIGLLFMGCMIGGYYGLYNTYHEASNTLDPLLKQSTIRTFLYNDILKVVKHVATFPFENVYHFLPWSFLIILFGYWISDRRVKLNAYSEFLGLAFLINIPVYWISPGYFPRYVLMLAPLFFAYFYGYYFDRPSGKWNQWFNKSLIGLMLLVIAASFMAPWIPKAADHTVSFALALAIGCLGIGLLVAIRMGKLQPWIAMVILLLAIRIHYNTSILPTKNISNGASLSRTEAKRISTEYQPLQLFQDARMDRSSSFYLATTQGKPLTRSEALLPEKYYLIDTFSTETPANAILVDSFKIVEFQRMIYVAKSK